MCSSDLTHWALQGSSMRSSQPPLPRTAPQRWENRARGPWQAGRGSGPLADDGLGGGPPWHLHRGRRLRCVQRGHMASATASHPLSISPSVHTLSCQLCHPGYAGPAPSLPLWPACPQQPLSAVRVRPHHGAVYSPPRLPLPLGPSLGLTLPAWKVSSAGPGSALPAPDPHSLVAQLWRTPQLPPFLWMYHLLSGTFPQGDEKLRL